MPLSSRVTETVASYVPLSESVTDVVASHLRRVTEVLASILCFDD